VRNGLLVDGSGSAPRRADVAIAGDRITFVGDAASAGITAARSIDATGLVVAPGFIDPHTHTQGDLSSAQRKANLAYLMQGVTTVVTNNDGGGPVDVGRVLDAVMGMSSAAPTAAQLDSMRRMVARAMDDGAIGMSTGLYYAPGRYATT